MPISAIIFRITLATVISGVIGFEREYKNRPAGIRTHILLCLGATIIALVQQSLSLDAIVRVTENPELLGVISVDQSRLIAQVVSGIGFLGAGTIIVTRTNILGLTTAATLWTVACLGITIGMGYYEIVLVGTGAIVLALTLLKKVIRISTIKKLQVKFIHRVETKEFITGYFLEKKVAIKDIDFSVDFQKDYRVYTNTYTIELPADLTYLDIIEDISVHQNVTNIKLLNV
ncbi:MgtC/SapB family protein [Carnobacterium gallinarum]|uniref:MgtC/SapB family protein n=1 Tax=Carnobacterium gallinarum TaxID=2749 RepID=UPI0005541533|nr:MgtC/SapB family protein [Carnobacterium gallinarum]